MQARLSVRKGHLSKARYFIPDRALARRREALQLFEALIELLTLLRTELIETIELLLNLLAPVRGKIGESLRAFVRRHLLKPFDLLARDGAGNLPIRLFRGLNAWRGDFRRCLFLSPCYDPTQADQQDCPVNKPVNKSGHSYNTRVV